MAGNAPVKTLRSGALKLSIWANEGKEGKKYLSAKLTKSYKNDQGDWKETVNLGERDWLVAAALLQEANSVMVIKEPEQKSGPSPY